MKNKKRWATLFSLCALTGCTVGPKYHAPVTQAPAGYKESPDNFKEAGAGPWTVAQPADAKLRGDWWTIFNDPELNTLEEQLNINNYNIKVYFEDLMQARALIHEARAQYFPTIGVAPDFSRQRSAGGFVATGTAGTVGTTTTTVAGGTTGSGSTTGTNTAAATSGRQVSIYSLPAEASWEPDLWGKVRNEVHEAEYAAQVSAADLQNERLTEQANLAAYFFEVHGQDALMQLYAATVEADQKALDLTKALYETGQDDYISVVEAQNTLQTAQASATNLGVLRAQYEHAIATLVGKPASSFSIPVRPISTAPPPIPIGLPSQLLQRRPDIAGAERVMAEANAEIGIATAAYYPNITLSGSFGTEASAIASLFDWSSRVWSVGTSISETVWEGGLRRATINQYIATYNADLASYRQTVLNAFQQVEDYLAAVRILSGQIEQQRQVVASAQQALNLEIGRYETGIDPYVDVVTLQTTVLTDQQLLLNLQIEQMTNAVELIAALGGGWDNSQMPTPAQLAARPTAADTKIQQ